jgi:hypothetical protein
MSKEESLACPTTAPMHRRFPPVAAAEQLSDYRCTAVAIGLPPLPPGQRLQSSRRQHRRCWSGYIGAGPCVAASRDFTAAIQV